jgi:hypothetical protein
MLASGSFSNAYIISANIDEPDRIAFAYAAPSNTKKTSGPAKDL